MVERPQILVGRRLLGMACAFAGVLLFASALFMYLRYTSDLNSLHGAERVRHGQLLSHLWQGQFYGAFVLSIVSLFGLGWSRWLGLAANASSFLCALMTLGAMCGPFGCQ